MQRFASAGSGRLSAQSGRWLLAAVLVVSALIVLPGCKGKKTVETPASSPPPPMFRGPAVFYGTIGSLARVR